MYEAVYVFVPAFLFVRNESYPNPYNTACTSLISFVPQTLPVRRLDFTRGLKRHLNKMLRFLQVCCVHYYSENTKSAGILH